MNQEELREYVETHLEAMCRERVGYAKHGMLVAGRIRDCAEKLDVTAHFEDRVTIVMNAVLTLAVERIAAMPTKHRRRSAVHVQGEAE